MRWTDPANRNSIEIYPDVFQTAAQTDRDLALYGTFTEGERRSWSATSCAPLLETDNEFSADLIGIATRNGVEPDIGTVPNGVATLLLVKIDGNRSYVGLWNPTTGEKTVLTVLTSAAAEAVHPPFEVNSRGPRERTQVRLEVPQWVWAAVLILAAGAISGHYYLRIREAASVPQTETTHRERTAYGFGMQASREGDNLAVRWDPSTPALMGSKSGVLKVSEGDQVIAIPLTAADIASGRMTYMPRSNSLGLELSVETGQGPVSERVRIMLEHGQPALVRRVEPAKVVLPAAPVPAEPAEPEPAPPASAVRNVEVPPARQTALPHAVVLTPAPTLTASAVTPDLSPVPFPIPPPQARQSLPAAPPERNIAIVPAVATRQIEPVIPETLKKIIMGRITIEVTARVGRNGSVIGVRTPAYSGIASHLAAAAETAVRGWKFRPATLDGKPVESVHLVRFSFDRSR